MPGRRATALVAFVVTIAIAQIALEDVVVFFAATGARSPAVLDSPLVLVGLPFALFCLLAGVLYAWAIGTAGTLR